MRIISGSFKGKKILLPKDKLTRPLKDLTKESIFNILKHSKLLNVELENSNILDYFQVLDHLVSNVYLEVLKMLPFWRVIQMY